ncbi:MAG: (d)CMP kinase [Prevotella sp.]|nr:(d)CMP kinase [Prevotella sp.]
MKEIIIAIDGFSSCGKSTMAKDLAKAINYVYIDSGAMYRAVALYCLQNNFFAAGKLDESRLKETIGNIRIDFKLTPASAKADTYLNGVNVETEIRSMEVAGKVSEVSAIPFVRREMVRLQQEMGKAKGIVMDGRDIGTVVFPNAELKIFVTASDEVRTQRRLAELRTKGDTTTTFEQVMQNIRQRDYTDQHRSESPLRKADDAILLDNTNITIEEQRQWLLDRFNETIER